MRKFENKRTLTNAIIMFGLQIILAQIVIAQSGNINNLELPLRGAFYYSWYPQTWTVGGEHVFYQPQLGYYTSEDEEVVEQHIEDMDYAKIDVAIASWWGIDRQKEALRFPVLLDKTIEANSKLKWAFYYEMEGFSNPTIGELKSDLDYLMEKYVGHEAIAKIGGKPVIFVYAANDQSCEVADRWVEATKGEWYVNLKVFGGFRNCGNQPDSWHQYGPATATQRHKGYSFVISPGFWRADESKAMFERDSARWYQNVRGMVASNEPWQLITTFNEWGEGTAIERCYDWPSQTKFGIYLDALHTDGIDAPVTGIKNDLYKNLVKFNYDPINEILKISDDVKIVEIYNITGTLLIKKRNSGSFVLPVNDLKNGIYIVRLSLEPDKIQTGKFIKSN